MNEVKFAAGNRPADRTAFNEARDYAFNPDLLGVEDTMQNALLTRNKMQDIFSTMYPENMSDGDMPLDRFVALLEQYKALRSELTGLIEVAAWQLDGSFEQARDIFLREYWNRIKSN